MYHRPHRGDRARAVELPWYMVRNADFFGTGRAESRVSAEALVGDAAVKK